jgi:hypothetical protein
VQRDGTQKGDAEKSVQKFLRLIKPGLNTEYYNSIPGIYEEKHFAKSSDNHR